MTTFHSTVPQTFAREVDRVASTTALVAVDGTRMDYRTLRARSRGLARQLRALGVRRDTRVAVYLDRSVDLIVSMLAILESGGCYVPIDIRYPAERTAALLRNASPRVLIANGSVPDGLGAGVRVLSPHDLVTDGRTSTIPRSAPDDLAYVIYTSGSTGTPKGVAMTQLGLNRLIAWQIEDGPKGLTTLQFTPICFDVTFQEVLSTLCSGGTLVLVSDDVRRDPERLLATIDEGSIQRLFLPYSALQLLASAAVRTGRVPQTLRHVITAGEQLVITDEIARFFSALPSCRLDNQYGPTETHLVTRYTLNREPHHWPRLPPIGAAATGVHLYCLDGDLRPVAHGEPGELYVGGDGLARGYLIAPAATAASFLRDPFSDTPDARMYRTGDLGRIGRDGIAEFLGRADDQIKVRGFRVEPGEIEHVLVAHPHVRQAAVGLRQIADGVTALVGYIVADGQPVTAAELNAYVRQRLPDYMAPSRVVFLDALPETATGKIDRRRLAAEIELPPPPPSPPAAAVDGAVDGASLTDTVRRIWERVLGHDEFELEDDFFDVGGDSRLAAWVASELTLAVGCDVKLSLLLADSTVRGIVKRLEAMTAAPLARTPIAEAVTLRAGPSHRALYLVHTLGGELLSYRELARSMRSPLRVLGLAWLPPEQGAAMSLAEMAAVHWTLLRSIQPHGPYLLAGWSFGGVLAYELARQIQADGAVVEFLGLLDANPVRESITGEPARDTRLSEKLTSLLTSLERGAERAALAALRSDPRLRNLLGDIPDGVSPARVRALLRVTLALTESARAYRAAPSTVPVDLFQPDRVGAATQACLHEELRPLAQGGLHIHYVPGDHYSMLRPPLVDALAKALDDALTTANRRTLSLAGELT